MKIEKLILRNLITNDEFARQVLPYLKDEYFDSATEKTLFKIFENYFNKYNKTPVKDELSTELDNTDSVQSEDLYDNVVELIGEVSEKSDVDLQWMVDETEKFCQDRAIYNAIKASISIIDGNDKKLDKGAIPEILTEALSIEFNSNIGHNYFEDVEERIEFYHRTEERIPFNIEYFNRITGGGLPKKTLNVFLAGCVHPDTKVKIRYRKK